MSDDFAEKLAQWHDMLAHSDEVFAIAIARLKTETDDDVHPLIDGLHNHYRASIDFIQKLLVAWTDLKDNLHEIGKQAVEEIERELRNQPKETQ